METIDLPEPALAQATGKIINLAILSNHNLFRECLASVFAKQAQYKVIALDEETTINELQSNLIDVVLIDINLLKANPVALIKDARQVTPQIKIIILGLTDVAPILLDCIEAGANGYVSKEASLDDLRKVIESIFRGEAVCSPRFAYFLFSRVAELSLERRGLHKIENVNLTPREFEILQLIADGLSNKQIAQMLYLSLHTVKNHVHKILEKLEIHHRSEAANFAIEKGFLRKRNIAPSYFKTKKQSN